MEHFVKGKASVIVGGQFGSEAKGLVAAHLASQNKMAQYDIICTTNAGAQAGHTTVLEDGSQFVCYHLPTAGVMLPESLIYINSGSIIDPELFLKEISGVCSVTGEDIHHIISRIVISPYAAVISDRHKEAEQDGSVSKIGSTRKGVGEALSSKIRREPGSVVKDHYTRMSKLGTISQINLNSLLATATKSVSVEIPQGTGLSINASGMFPNCTSRDCWVGQGLTDAGINPAFLGHVAMVCRTFPIRVGNITDENGNITGHSGPFYGGSQELDWGRDFPGVPVEITTVTKRIRRIATWSYNQYQLALELNRPHTVYMTFTNYLYRYKNIPSNLFQFAEHNRLLENDLGMNNIKHVYSWGPRINQCSDNLAFAEYQSRLAKVKSEDF